MSENNMKSLRTKGRENVNDTNTSPPTADRPVVTKNYPSPYEWFSTVVALISHYASTLTRDAGD